MTAIPPDASAMPEEIRAEISRLINSTVRTAQLRHRYLPSVGSAAWWSAPDEVRLATIMVLGGAYVVFSPTDATFASVRDVSLAISTGTDWSADAHRMIFESTGKLTARRAIAATPLRCGHERCLSVISVEHPLPDDWSTVRCPKHGEGAVA